jgi:hypothetical protein
LHIFFRSAFKQLKFVLFGATASRTIASATWPFFSQFLAPTKLKVLNVSSNNHALATACKFFSLCIEYFHLCLFSAMVSRLIKMNPNNLCEFAISRVTAVWEKGRKSQGKTGKIRQS